MERSERKRKENVQNTNRRVLKNNKGIFLAESLVSLAITGVLILSIIPFYQLFLSGGEKENTFSNEELFLFSQHLQLEINEAKTVWTSHDGKKLLFILEGNSSVIHFEKYQYLIRRQVGGLGHEVHLQHIKDITFSMTEKGIKVNVTSLSGRTYTFFLYHLNSIF